MGTILLISKIALVLLSLCGIMMLFHYRFKVDAAFAPVFAVGTVISVTFAGGILNIMPKTIAALYAAGAVLFVYYAVRILMGREKASFILSPQTIIFFVGCAFAMLYCRDIIFHLSDELSHWGTMIKEMCTVKGFPDARTVIDYKEYPPAAAIFAYFFLFATGFSEPLCYVAQAVFTISCCVAVLHGVKWKNIWTAPFSLAMLFIICDISEVTITSLLVDYLMPVMAIALAAYTIENREKLAENPVGFAALTCPVFTALCLIKTNAVALYAMYLFIVVYILRKELFAKDKAERMGREKLLRTGGIYAVPAAALFIWKNYIDKVYLGEGYDTVKFAMTKENLLKNYYEKSPELIGRIVKDVTEAAFTSDMFITIIICFVLAFAFGKLFNCEEEDKKVLRFSAVWAVVSWFVYIIGYGLMLVFLMPEWEFNPKSTLICFGRYVGTAAGFAAGIVLYQIVRMFVFKNENLKKHISCGLCAVILVGLWLCNGTNPGQIIQYRISDNIRSTYEFTSALDYSKFNRDDTLGFYTGEISEDSHWINNFHMRRTVLNKNIYMFNNEAVDGIEYDESLEDIYQYLRRTDFIVQIIPHENFVPLMEQMNIEVDTPDGIMYEVIKDRLDCPVKLVRVQ
ncbi:MAG: hypothetical protein IKU47_01905 [Oscillospiraceae bacterium]|nr:hypothetical protein [Oscillospiraceae bacterium]